MTKPSIVSCPVLGRPFLESERNEAKEAWKQPSGERKISKIFEEEIPGSYHQSTSHELGLILFPLFTRRVWHNVYM